MQNEIQKNILKMETNRIKNTKIHDMVIKKTNKNTGFIPQ